VVQVERLFGSLELVEDTDEVGAVTQRATALTARHETHISPNGGSYCPELIGVDRGQFMVLPCTVAYELTGVASTD
jgi:hypothetical protein